MRSIIMIVDVMTYLLGLEELGELLCSLSCYFCVGLLFLALATCRCE